MDAQKEIYRLLTEHEAVLIRDDNHEVWQLKDNKRFTIPKTPSDIRSYSNCLSTLRKLLGITKTVATEGVRREKKVKVQRNVPIKYDKKINTGLGDSIAIHEFKEVVLKERVSQLERKLIGKTERETYHNHIRRLKRDNGILVELLAKERLDRTKERLHYIKRLRSRWFWIFDFIIMANQETWKR